jgi:uncharacterized protein YdaU (DUF1376 family)
MSDKVDIWMPWYVRDYLADTARLTTEQHGGYMLLIGDYWMSGPLPSDDLTLMRITKMSVKSWAISGPILRAFFSLCPDGRLYHKRIEEELQKAKAKKEVTVSRAKKAAEHRWDKSSASRNAPSIQSDAPRNAPRNAPSIPDDAPSMPKALLKDMLGDAPSPSPSPKTSAVTQPALVNQDNSVVAPTSAPRSKKPERNAGVSPIGSLPCVGGKSWQFFQSDVDEWQCTYVAVDVVQQLRQMKQWLKANSLKTHKGMRKFVINWLGNAQDRGPRKEGNRGYKPFNRAQANLDSAVQSGLTAIAEINELCDPVDQAGGTVRRTNGHEGSTPSADGRGVVGSPSGSS